MILCWSRTFFVRNFGLTLMDVAILFKMLESKQNKATSVINVGKPDPTAIEVAHGCYTATPSGHSSDRSG